MDVQTIELLQVNASVVSSVREEDLFGRPHLVVPVIMVREMVLPHRGRRELLPEAALAQSVRNDQWEGRPVVVRHPRRHGRFVSAGIKDVAEEYEIGRIQNTRMDRGRLKAELWIDVDRANEHEDGEKLLNDFRDGKIVEVSTGYLADTFPEVGTFGNETFDHVQVNIRPDHVAVLPDEIGKCSISDGCGAGRMNADGSRENAISHEDLQRALREKLHEMERVNGSSDFLFIEAVFDDRVVYQVNEGPLLERSFTLGEAPEYNVDIAEEMMEVRRIIDFVATNSDDPEEEVDENTEGNDQKGRIATAVQNLLSAVGLRDSAVSDDEPVANSEGHAAGDTEDAGAPISQEAAMDRNGLIELLVNSEDHEFERCELEPLSDRILMSLAGDEAPEELAPSAVTDGGAAPAAGGGDSDDGAGDGSAVDADEDQQPVALSKGAVLAALGVEEQDFDGAMEVVRNSRAAEESERTQIVDRLTANSDCPYVADDLSGMSIAGLRKMDEQYSGVRPSFVGRGGPRTNSQPRENAQDQRWSDGIVMRRGPKPDSASA